MTTEISECTPKYKRGQHPNSRKNLRVGGITGNGNLAGSSLTAELRRALNEEAEFVSPTARPKDKLWREQIKRAILAKAACGDVPMVNTLLDRTEGKVPERHHIEASVKSISFIEVVIDDHSDHN